MTDDRDIKTMKGSVDKASKAFKEDGSGRTWILYKSPYQAKPDLIDLTDYAGHKVTVTYEHREGNSAYGCDVGTGRD